MGLNSGLRKRAIGGWLKDNYRRGFASGLKLQKFLFFYETLSKIEGDKADFSYLRGYKNGPVFSDVYGDYFYRKEEFIKGVDEAYKFKPDLVNEKRAKFASFLVNILNEEELSELTHELNIWKSKEKEINSNIRQVTLEEKDLTNDDIDLINSLRETYSDEYIASVEVIEIANKSFIIKKEDISRMNEDQKNALITLSSNDDLDNPVYVTLSEDGVLLVD